MSNLVFTSTTQQNQTSRRLSILSNPRSRRQSSVSSTSSAAHELQGSHELSIEFDKTMIRPNKIIRGVVKLKTLKPVQASQIRIKFKAEETASAKVKESGLDSKVDKIESVITTYFDVDTIVWGSERSAYSINYWQTLEPGEHEFQFALKFPNVNFPPSTDDPSGFSIRYVWKAFLDGPANHPGLRSPEYATTYRPLISAPPPTQWTFQETVYKDNKKSPLAVISATLPAQVFCPEDTITVDLKISPIPSDANIVGIQYKFRKYYEGRLLLQQGSVSKSYYLDIIHKSVPVTKSSPSHTIQIDLPARLVSPCFTSKNIRVFYSLLFTIQIDCGSLLKTSHYTPFEIPIGMANIANSQLAQVPDLTLIRDYSESQEAPYFFDPSLDVPPHEYGAVEYDDSVPMDMMALSPPPDDSLPSYFSVGEMHQFVRRKRCERVRSSSRLVKPHEATDLGEPLPIQPYFDDEW